MSAIKRIGLLGTGNRGRFLLTLLLEQRPDWRCGILIDPHRPSLERARAELGDPAVTVATEFAAAASAPAMDGWLMAGRIETPRRWSRYAPNGSGLLDQRCWLLGSVPFGAATDRQLRINHHPSPIPHPPCLPTSCSS